MDSISQITKRYKEASGIEEWNAFIEEYQSDSRNGVMKLVNSAKKQILAYENEVRYMKKNMRIWVISAESTKSAADLWPVRFMLRRSYFRRIAKFYI